MKRILAAVIGILIFAPLFARHIRGGEMSYKYLGPGTTAGTSSYLLRLKLYIDCTANDPGQDEPTAPFTVYDRDTKAMYLDVLVNRTSEQLITWDPASNPCITNPPTDICYKLKYFETTVQLPDNPGGYTVAYQRCCRINAIENLSGTSSNDGATYSADIPGTSVLPTGHNSSPVISGNDAIAICAGSAFSFDFSATDAPDNDSLVYTLCAAYNGGGPSTQSNNCTNCPAPDPAAPPPYNDLPYNAPFSGTSPLGPSASMDPHTGIISGIAPGISAQYVVTGCIYEYRNGTLINVHRKDIHLKVSDCNPLRALLSPDYDYCDDYNVNFHNEQVNPTGTIYIWNYGDGTKTDTSTDALGAIQHKFADTGTYKIHLKVVLAGQCTDSTTTLARVYPGFYPGFVVYGSCLYTPLQFTDTTKTKYGFVSAWRWDFGDETTSADTSHTQNPQWKYSTLGVKQAQLIVQSNKGCIDTVLVNLEVKNKPLVTVPFPDTLICSNLPLQDTLMLGAQGDGNGQYSWTPLTRIVNPNTATPLVFPTNTTVYYVQFNDNGCINIDSITVRVVDHVTLDAGPDSTICLTDSITLHPNTDATGFAWSPLVQPPNVKNPVVIPTAAATTYHLVATIGKCNVADDVTIRTVPYPTANAGADQIICFGDTTVLNATIKGSSFNWSPAYSLINPGSLTPEAHPLGTTGYVLAVYDVLGCPKPSLDTVLVTVRPPLFASAGNDTSVTIGQPLTLHASGAPLYLWTPADFLDHNDIASPTAVFNSSGTYLYTVKGYTTDNCSSTATIRIKVFNTAPNIYVPNAFTPGGTENTVFRPIPVGIARIDYFRIYNRLGNMVFSSSDGSGWNGIYGGKQQAPGTYVWVVEGHDYTGKVIAKKGTMVLIR